ncbi:hypothetical protein [Streptomyces sp. AK02-01A]|uniref:hypothetical protein n=1 Tax=Streptomyces sp. AK02-01A TaxID=3028648 RepID=UPI0029A098A8|nr:hypothetical protein [Streptomyces sp. AK02-01A]MDX3855038.1 hypothetical protein [Streptomyces sp. AK02-01A]
MNEPLTHSHWLAHAAPKVVPAVATSTVLILGRIWNANGAEHSVGNAALMIVLSAGAGVAGVFAAAGRSGGDGVLAGIAFATSGSLALAGVAGYADGLPLPLLLWAVATAVAYGIAARYWRTDRRDTLAYERGTTIRHEEHAHVERIETIRGHTQIEVAREGAAYAEALAQALAARAALPGFNPQTLEKAGLPELPAGKDAA